MSTTMSTITPDECFVEVTSKDDDKKLMNKFREEVGLPAPSF